ncbi:MAG: double-strand break repair protein AddB [Beijerinckiaceae bacterium]
MAGQPRLFSIPAGADFVPVFAGALLEGRIVPGFPDASDPLALGDAKIFVPTRRAARALASELAERQGARAAILPQILPLGALGEAENAALFDPEPGLAFSAAVTAEAAGDLERRLALTELILKWGQQIRNAIQRVHRGVIKTFDTEDFLVTRAPGQAFHMAGQLAALIDETIIEDVDWRDFGKLVAAEFDPYWSITLAFLKIAMEAWPKHLEETGRTDAMRRYVMLADAEAARLATNPPAEPWIVAGSTGTNAATARLIGAIARLPRGAAILPGLDRHMDEASWSLLGARPDADPSRDGDAAAGHPQAALARLMGRLGVTRDDVKDLCEPDEIRAPRMRFLSQALLPAESTQMWIGYRKTADDAAIAAALANVAFVDADSERAEALAIAIAMRETLETPGKTAALITPDRNLARRVRSELLRWNIAVDDSSGDSLKNRPAGVLARLALQAGADTSDPAATAALLGHADIRLGYETGELRRLAGLVELGILRGPVLAAGETAAAIEHAREVAADIHAHPSKKTISDSDWSAIAGCLQRLAHALDPLTGMPGNSSLHGWFAALRESVSRLTARTEDEAPAQGEDHRALENLFEEFAAAPDALSLTHEEFAAFSDTVSFEATVRGPYNAHPRLKILGLLEARLLPADLKILAGLDETVWPPAAKADAFLNRPMRAQLGLSPPERRIGQTTHDFVEAIGAREAIVTRARKRGDAPAIPSRLVQRMKALAGDAWAACEGRGRRLLELADALDRPAQVRPAARPEPRPPLDVRPQRLSVTQIEAWRRDPYGIYAQKILRLLPLEALGAAPTAADTGTGLHEAIARYQKEALAGDSEAAAVARMSAIAEDVFADRRADDSFRLFEWPRILEALHSFVAWARDRRGGIATLLIEKDGGASFALEDGTSFELTARADEIGLLRDGSAVIVDYKSKKVPSNPQIEAGFAPQMTLEAAIAENGGFADLPAGTRVAQASYVKLLGKDGVEERALGVSKRRGETPKTFEELKEQHLAGFIDLANQFRRLETAYIPRPYPQYVNVFSDYDHLARTQEWLGEAGESE